jgi:hypothetical protein
MAPLEGMRNMQELEAFLFFEWAGFDAIPA